MVLDERMVPRDAKDEALETLDALEALLCFETLDPLDDNDPDESSRCIPESRGWWEGLLPR